MISTTTTTAKRYEMLSQISPFIATLITATLLLVQLSTIESAYEQPNDQQSSPIPNNLCPKSWIHINQKCYRFYSNPRNYISAKNRCQDLSSRLAIVEDESSKEKEMSVGAGLNIVTHLSNDQRRSDLQSRQYFVDLSQDLLNQYQAMTQNASGSENYDHADEMSDLWLPRDDPTFLNITSRTPDQRNTGDSFVLALSNHYKRWGLIAVSPNRKMSFICEREVQGNLRSSPTEVQPSAVTPNHQNSESRRNFDLNIHAAPGSFSYSLDTRSSSTSPEIKKPIEKESSLAPQPDSSSMLFREYPQDQSVLLESTAEMRCSPLESESSLQWTVNGKNLTQNNRVKSYTNGTLRIEQVRSKDRGNYTCTIFSGITSESRTARLEILEKPHPPAYITAELLDERSTSVRIKWTPGFNGNSPIIKYSIEMHTVDNENFENEMNTAIFMKQWDIAKANISADQTSVIIPDLKPARKYIFRITATTRVGTSDPSTPTKRPIEVPVQPPSSPPDNLSGLARSSTSIAIQWLPPPPDSQNGVLKGYKIRRKLAGYTSGSDWYTNDVTDAARTNFVLDDLIAWQNYEIQIAAENDKGVGPFSSSIIVRTKEGRPDEGPENVSAEAINSTVIRINWYPPPPQQINGLNQGYKVQAWFDAQHTQLAKELVVPHNTITPLHTTDINGLAPYTKYYLTVRCFTNAGDGPANEENIDIKTKQDFPEAVPVLEFTDVLDKSLKVMWKPPQKINGELDHYTLEYWEATTADRKISKKFPPSTTEVRIVDLTPQTGYVFKIYPHTNVGSGPGKVNQTTTSVPPVLPDPPSSLNVTEVGPYTAIVNFTPGFDGNALIERWVVEAITPLRGDASRWHTIYTSTNHSNSNSVVVRNLRPFTRYKLRLTPANIVGASRSPSESTHEFQTAQTEPEQAPKDLSIEDIKANSVLARWSPLSKSLWLGNALGYNLTWSESNNSTTLYSVINDTRADSYLVRDLEEYTEYIFRIYSLNEVGSSPASEPISIITSEDVPSSSPTNLTAHALSSTTVSVDWNPVPKRHRNGIIRGYKIQYQATKTDAPLQHKTVEDNSTKHVTLNDLKPYTTYHLAVAAYTSTGDGVYSQVLNVQTLEDTPGTPQNLSFPTVSQTAARILWDPPEDANGDIIGYKVSYHGLAEGSKEVASHELHQNERTFKASNLKPDTHYVFTVTAKTKEGWGQQASILMYTYDSELRANLPFFKESWFVILCACSSVVITIIITAILFVQTKSYKYKQDAIKSTSQDRLGEAGFSIDDELGTHYNNGFGLLSHTANHRRSNGALSQSTANFTLPKSPPRPHPGSVVYSDDGDDDVFEETVDKQHIKNAPGPSHYDSSNESLTEKPSEISSSTAPESESPDDEYVNMANKNFVNHYANVNGTLRGQKAWKKSSRHYSSNRTKPKLPQRPAPSIPQVPGEPSSSSSDVNNNNPLPGNSGANHTLRASTSSYSQQPPTNPRPVTLEPSQTNGHKEQEQNSEVNNLNTQQTDLLNGHIVNLNGGRIIVDNMAGSRAPLPGFTSFV